MRRFEEMLAPFRLNEGQLDERTAQQQRTEFPWKVTDKEMDALRLKVSVCVFDLNVQLQYSPAQCFFLPVTVGEESAAE